MPEQTELFAAYPSCFVYAKPDSHSAKIQHLLWGDFITPLNREDGQFIKVRARGDEGWIRKEETRLQRLLELYFVDIGQGDGCFMVTPDNQFVLIDAGEGDNMFRYLRWRFNLKKAPDRKIHLPHVVISHPDADHYGGLKHLVESPQFTFGTVYHNGIMERKGDDRLGVRQSVDGESHLVELIEQKADLAALIEQGRAAGVTNLFEKMLDAERVEDIRMLCTADQFLPGFGQTNRLRLRVLGPAPKITTDGKRLLPWFGDVGKTKNGHSIVLKLEYQAVNILLGGDLNRPAEHHLLQHHTGLPADPMALVEREQLVHAARATFQVDIAKACHHGSSDFSTTFMQAVHPLATVVSSGDSEPHSHPRPDALGAIGKWGRGERPLVFSTELARSSNESIKAPFALRKQLQTLIDQKDRTEDATKKAALQRKINKLLEQIERSVAVYGLINLRTDGHRVVIAQKLEEARPSGEKWDLHRLEPDDAGQLHYASKHL
jgi:beta-lactamase superfamily II metal-dependent hydrolase